MKSVRVVLPVAESVVTDEGRGRPGRTVTFRLYDEAPIALNIVGEANDVLAVLSCHQAEALRDFLVQRLGAK